MEIPLSQQDISDALGLTPIHVNRVLRRLREKGLMTFRYRQLVIADLEGLGVAAGFQPDYLDLA